MRFWVRELLGWILVGLGLFAFAQCFSFLGNWQAVSAGIVAVIGIVIFRAGIHLLKMALAARVYLQARQELRDDLRRADPARSTAGPARSPRTERRR